jgi:hypothetical protein
VLEMASLVFKHGVAAVTSTKDTLEEGAGDKCSHTLGLKLCSS